MLLLERLKAERAQRQQRLEDVTDDADAVRERCKTLHGFVKEAWPVLEPGTQFVDNWHLAAICEHLEAITYGQITRLQINIPPGSMKALDSDTPILTTWGWKRHGDLRPGDFVFGPDGQPKRVLACTQEVQEEAYAVEFDDGASIVAGAGHLWEVDREITLGPRKRAHRVVSTLELRTGTRTIDGWSPDRIAVPKAVAFPPRDLIIDPYLLGAWLGDGASKAGCIYAGEQDVADFRELGEIARVFPPDGTRKQNFYRIAVPELQTKLRVMGLLGNKHIPAEYLTASIDQRVALLQGLMDTDGTCSEDGACSFTNKNASIANGLRDLVVSLGMKASVHARFAELNGKKFGPHYYVTFRGADDISIFRLARKQSRVNSSSMRTKVRYVKRVTSVGVRTIKCIQVEGEMYLAGRELIPTHNSLLASVMFEAWEWGPGNMPWLRYLGTSYDEDYARRDSRKMRDLVQSSWYQALWPIELTRFGEGSFENTMRGGREAKVFANLTGGRAEKVVLDDPHSVDSAESVGERMRVTRRFRESLQSRLNDPKKDAIIVIMQRLHEKDVCGVIEELGLPYTKLILPMEFEKSRRCITHFGGKTFTDPRTKEGELLDPGRFPQDVVDRLKQSMGAHAWCTPTESPVLMADLSLRSIGGIKEGDEVVGFDIDAGVGKQRCLKVATVAAVSRSIRPVVKITLDSGRVIRCTADHRWYTARSDFSHKPYLPARIGSELMRVCDPKLPLVEDTRDAGWLGGFFDGEGSVSLVYRRESSRPHASITFTQGTDRNAPLCQKLEECLTKFGFNFSYSERLRSDRKDSSNSQNMMRTYWLRGQSLPLIQRFLHIVQPVKWRNRLIENALMARFIIDRERVVSIEADGEEEVFGLTTTTGNYVVWGLASSNSGQYQQRPTAREGGLFKRQWFQIVDAVPSEANRKVRRWDLAATIPEDGNDPDWTVGLKMSTGNGNFYIEDVIYFRDVGASVRRSIKATAVLDGRKCQIIIPQDPGQAGKDQAKNIISENAGYRIGSIRETGEKGTRAEPFAAQLEAGNVYLVRGPWNETFIDQLCGFPVGHDDMVDAASGAFTFLAGTPGPLKITADILNRARTTHR